MHGVVVLLPMVIVGTIAIALRPASRARYGFLVVGAGLAATIMVPVATSSGESLEERVGDPGEHAELGDQLLWFAVALLLTSALLVLMQRRADRTTASTVKETTGPGTARVRLTAVAALAAVAAVACGVQVYRVGDSGARAAWGDTPTSEGGK